MKTSQISAGEISVPGGLGELLDLLGELDLHGARQVEAVLGAQDVGDAALARLGVDADDRLVGAPGVLGVDRQVGHLPHLVVVADGGHPLLDRVLVRTGEGRVDEFAHVGVAHVHRQPVRVLGDVAGLVDVADVQFGVDALGEEVERQRDDVDVAGALAVAEERALDAIGAGQARPARRRRRRCRGRCAGAARSRRCRGGRRGDANHSMASA